MGYKRYVSEKSAKARRQENFQKKKAKKNAKPAVLITDDKLLEFHSSSLSTFTVKKK